jgi:hypothetical protein
MPSLGERPIERHNCPPDRYIRSPRGTGASRARERERNELDREIGWVTVPELPLPTMLPSDAVAGQTSAAPYADSVSPPPSRNASPLRLLRSAS